MQNKVLMVLGASLLLLTVLNLGFSVLCAVRGGDQVNSEGVINAIEAIKKWNDLQLNPDCTYDHSGYKWLFQ